MRREDPGTRGRIDVLKVALGAAALFGAALIVYPNAFADDPQVAELTEVIETQPARHRKLMALKELCDLDSRAAREAVIALSGSDDEQVAIAAITAMSREGFSGARSALEGIAEDTSRSDAVRQTALGAYMKLRKEGNRSWSSERDWVRERTRGNARMTAFADAWSRKLWGEEVDDE